MEKLYSTPVISVNPDSSIFEALHKMQAEFVKRLVITDGTKPLGIITERDIDKFLEDDKTARAIDEIPVEDLPDSNYYS